MNTDTTGGTTLYEALGGSKTVDLLVSALYFQILSDVRIARFFENTSIERIMAHQRSFLTMALSGEAVYAGRSLAEAHAELISQHGLLKRHFDIVLEHLNNALLELGTDAAITRQVVERVAATKTMIFPGG